MRQLVGTWQLESGTARTESGEVRLPLGDRPQGVLIITAVGWLSNHIASRDRPRFKALPLGDPAEQAGAFATYTGYRTRNLDAAPP